MPRTKTPTTKSTTKTISKTTAKTTAGSIDNVTAATMIVAGLANYEAMCGEKKARENEFVTLYMKELYGFVRDRMQPFIDDITLARFCQDSGQVQRLADGFRDPDATNNGMWDLAVVIRACRFRDEHDRLQAYIRDNNLQTTDLSYGIAGFDNKALHEFVEADWRVREKINYRRIMKTLLESRTCISRDVISEFIKDD